GLTVALVAAAVVSIANVIFFQLENLLRPMTPAVEKAISFSIGALIVIAAAALVVVWRFNSPKWSAIVATVLLLAIGMAPRVVDSAEKREAMALRAAEDLKIDLTTKAEIEMRTQDLEARIASKRPFTPVEAQSFVQFVGSSDLSHRRLPDYSSVTFP